ncbi:hypothetical protein [Reyranella sp.]|uniref:hypothetical protein n=1 Tax=Reyranella sp. TaxID=1929291 RepID=UPI00272F4C94|nr:hypothetical protein [Reyranella sp.]MDP2373010.1 hypothetical protein [Reyranella sp.]
MKTGSDALGGISVRADLDNLIAVGCFGVACAIGLVGAFVGLDVSSFWLDELFEAWINENGISVSEFIARLVTDLHPPAYHVLVFLYSRVFGDSEVSLRSFSALCATGAILLFIVATKSFFSLPARLFGAAMATGSFFWFYHAQNARGYSLSFVIGVGILAISLSILAKRSQPDARLLPHLAGLAVLMLVGSFVHFYLMYECLAVLIVLGYFCPRQRIVLIAFACVLLTVTGLYVKYVIEVFSQYSTTTNWIHGDPVWYASQLRTAVIYSFTKKALLALAICAGAFALQRLFVMRQLRLGWTVSLPPGAAAAAPKPGFLALGRFPLDPETALFVGVPVIVLAGGVASSLLLSPNFTDRNLLVCSPFLWAFSARLYDGGVPGAERLVRAGANLALSAIVLWMAITMVAGRAKPWNEPFRESAEWIRSFPACRDRPILIINAQPRAWFKPGYSEVLYADFYGNYLGNFAQPEVVFIEDIRAHKVPEDVKDYLRWRIDGNGCPILAWSIHLITEEEFAAAGQELLKAVGRPNAGRIVQTKVLRNGIEGFVLYAEGASGPGQFSAGRDPGPPPSQRKTGPAPSPTRRASTPDPTPK